MTNESVVFGKFYLVRIFYLFLVLSSYGRVCFVLQTGRTANHTRTVPPIRQKGVNIIFHL